MKRTIISIAILSVLMKGLLGHAFGQDADKLHLWTDLKRYTIQAKFIKADANSVTLHYLGFDREVKVPLNYLSPASQTLAAKLRATAQPSVSPTAGIKDAKLESSSKKPTKIVATWRCDYFGKKTSDEIWSFASDTEAEGAIRRILNSMSPPLKPNFTIRAANVRNASAMLQKSHGGLQRLILYNQEFMIRVKSTTKTDWGAISILAHEIGHHLQGHTLRVGGSSPDIELEADEFSGGVLARMGANLAQAQAAMKLLGSDSGSKTHPPRSARLAAITKGWKFAHDSLASKSPAPIPKASKSPASRPKGDKAFTIHDLSLIMLFCPPGSFWMGTHPPDTVSWKLYKNRYDGEATLHPVTLSEGFWLGKHEVTQHQFHHVMGFNPSGPQVAVGRGHPVNNVNWFDAVHFCKKLTESERAAGRLPAGMAYQLPTEAQWEYACRAGTNTSYSFGSKLKENQAIFHTGRAHSVGSCRPNYWGFHDMHGNVEEWCKDWYGKNPSSKVRDPVGPESGSKRIVRGGSWSVRARKQLIQGLAPGSQPNVPDSVSYHLLTSYGRGIKAPANSSTATGFRISLQSIQRY